VIVFEVVGKLYMEPFRKCFSYARADIQVSFNFRSFDFFELLSWCVGI
jgi:hypothetical protein